MSKLTGTKWLSYTTSNSHEAESLEECKDTSFLYEEGEYLIEDKPVIIGNARGGCPGCLRWCNCEEAPIKLPKGNWYVEIVNTYPGSPQTLPTYKVTIKHLIISER